MTEYIEAGGLHIDAGIHAFVEARLPGTFEGSSAFWEKYRKLLDELAPQNADLLKTREDIQLKISAYYRDQVSGQSAATDDEHFLRGIGYIVEEGADFTIETPDVDPEFSRISGPQLVVPLSNARYALNALNARWGSLFDALYGSNVIEVAPCDDPNDGDPRKAAVVQYAAEFLDKAVPLADGSHASVSRYYLHVSEDMQRSLIAELDGCDCVSLANPRQLAGYLGSTEAPSTLLFVNNGLHIELQIDKNHPVGKTAFGHVKDVVLEAALTVIQDLEDAVAVVDASDKLQVYKNWSGLLDGTLSVSFEQRGKTVHRRPNQDRIYFDAKGDSLRLKGRSVMLVRHTGLLLNTDCVLSPERKETPEGILDAVITTLCALKDVNQSGGLRNSNCGRIYVVKPKLHGPEEVAFTERLLARVEKLFSLPPNTVCLGVMDEERRTSVNLKECIRAAKNRIVFINTGFLDRTGDEVHTCTEAGIALPRGSMKTADWYRSYEKRNVGIGLKSGFRGRAQIGKGMWAVPDNLSGMMATKGAHPKTGANCAWVPSPTAAVLHAIHYHETDVDAVQAQFDLGSIPNVSDLLKAPMTRTSELSGELLRREIRNYAQGILGYVVRWVDQGIGCSTIPDIDGIGLMEDRATLRITSQTLANWLKHGACSPEDIKRAFGDVAPIIDAQNAADSAYRPFPPKLEDSMAFCAALELVLEGASQPNGYTDVILQRARRKFKAATMPI